MADEEIMNALLSSSKGTHKLYLSKALFGLRQSLEQLTPADIDYAHKVVQTVLLMRYMNAHSTRAEKARGREYLDVLDKASDILHKHLAEIKGIFRNPHVQVVRRRATTPRRRRSVSASRR